MVEKPYKFHLTEYNSVDKIITELYSVKEGF